MGTLFGFCIFGPTHELHCFIKSEKPNWTDERIRQWYTGSFIFRVLHIQSCDFAIYLVKYPNALMFLFFAVYEHRRQVHRDPKANSVDVAAGPLECLSPVLHP